MPTRVFLLNVATFSFEIKFKTKLTIKTNAQPTINLSFYFKMNANIAH